jgi:peptidoglycan/LPS O-acetylase OafA/YrhL
VAERGGRIGVLDGWRAVSVTMVIVGHLLHFSSIRIDTPIAHAMDQYAYLGVQIFFVISGFVICRGFIKERAEFGRVSLAAFYVRRFFRIIPPLCIYVFVIAILAYSGIVEPIAVFTTRSLVFACNFPNINCGGWLGGHTWSLSTEEQFYMVFPLIFLVSGAHGKIVTAGLAVTLPCLCLLFYATKFTHTAAFISLFVSIAAGVAWAMNEKIVRAATNTIPRGAFFVALGLLLIIAHFSGSRVATVFNVLFVAPLIVTSLMLSMKDIPLVSVFLKSGPVRWLGVVSYSLYLWQQLATNAFPHAGIGFYAVSLGGCLLWVTISFYWIERPLMEIGRTVSVKLRRTRWATANL